MYDVIVIGGGAAGLYAAGIASRNSLSVCLLEKKHKTGLKLSITGKGRCNITNSASMLEFINLTRNGKFLHSAYRTLTNTDLITFFENLNVPLKLERGGRYFPASGSAHDIVKALNSFAVNAGAEILTSYQVNSIEKTDDVFIINKSLKAKNIIVSTGGVSYPKTGSEGDGYKFAKQFGHKIIKPLPALVPITLNSPYLKNLNKLKLKNVEIEIKLSGKTLAREFGEMEFSVFGADGPIILSVSGVVSENAGKPLSLHINLKPAVKKEEFEKRFLKELDTCGAL
ncbi:MAG: aminoacetone oxidase family FAD-binding enzyme, partial [Elusimicrobia bacterium]|nr:aminoacetone oxidase family FAD-binding enzyme [Elusimicrobiota bacterium]